MDYQAGGTLYIEATYLDATGNAIVFDPGTSLTGYLKRNGVLQNGSGSTANTAVTASSMSGLTGGWSASLSVPGGWTNGTDIVQAVFQYTLNGNLYEDSVGPATRLDGKVPATLAAADVSGNLPANAVQVAGQTANAAGAVTFPSSIGTSTYSGGAVASVTGNVGGNVVGSVGSVTGAVGSVTGAVGSVTGAVGSVAGNIGGNLAGTVGDSRIAAIKSQTDLIGTTGADSSNVTAIKAKTDNLPADPAATSDIAAGWTTAMTEAYAATGSPMTPAEALYMIYAVCAQFAVSGTSIIAKKLDGTTTALTFTIDSSTAPTERTRT